MAEDATVGSAPIVLNPSRWRNALWVIERTDRRGLCVWEDHSKRQPGEQPDHYLLVFTSDENAERYNEQHLKYTGHIMPVTFDTVIAFFAKIKESGIDCFLMDFDRDRDDNAVIVIDDFLHYLRTGSRAG